MSDWWDDINRTLDDRASDADDLPDPWAEVDIDAEALTAEQTEFLEQLTETSRLLVDPDDLAGPAE